MAQEEVLFTITDDELVLEEISEFEIELASGWIDYWNTMVFCNMCGEDMNADDAYDDCRSYFGRTKFLCKDCDEYHSAFHYNSDKWKETREPILDILLALRK
jgi:hypothetical protein